MIGTTLGHYRIVRSLGSGGMGEVSAAQDAKLNREGALKVLPGATSDNPERRERFEREAKAVAALNPPPTSSRFIRSRTPTARPF